MLSSILPIQVNLSVSNLACLTPNRGRKAAELAKIRRALGGARRALRDSPLAPEADRLTMVGLVLWRDHVATLREWPFEAAVLRRFALYLLIPLGSWVGAAFVERVVDRFF